MGTMTGISRWWSSPTRKRCCPDLPTGFRLYKAVSPARSASGRTPRKYANHGLRWRPRVRMRSRIARRTLSLPASTVGPVRQSPYAIASPAEPTGTPQYRANFRGMSAGRTPWPGIAQYREMSALSGRHDNARRSARMCSMAGNPSTARTASFRRSWANPPREMIGETAANFKSTPRKIVGKPLYIRYFEAVRSHYSGQ